MKYLLTLLQVIGILTSGLHGNAVTGGLFARFVQHASERLTTLLFAESSEATAVAAATTDDTLTPVALSIDVTTTVVTLYIDPEDTAATETPADTAEPAAESAPEPPEPTAAPSAIATKPDDFIDMDECAKCICWSWSSCDARFCDSSTQLCNMYHIEYVAWRASGAPSIPDREFPNPVSAFEHCRSNTTCAIKTISQYFELHKAVSDATSMRISAIHMCDIILLLLHTRTATKTASSTAWM